MLYLYVYRFILKLNSDSNLVILKVLITEGKNRVIRPIEKKMQSYIPKTVPLGRKNSKHQGQWNFPTQQLVKTGSHFNLPHTDLWSPWTAFVLLGTVLFLLFSCSQERRMNSFFRIQNIYWMNSTFFVFVSERLLSLF